jgi:hypothetical protein
VGKDEIFLLWPAKKSKLISSHLIGKNSVFSKLVIRPLAFAKRSRMNYVTATSLAFGLIKIAASSA